MSKYVIKKSVIGVSIGGKYFEKKDKEVFDVSPKSEKSKQGKYFSLKKEVEAAFKSGFLARLEDKSELSYENVKQIDELLSEYERALKISENAGIKATEAIEKAEKAEKADKKAEEENALELGIVADEAVKKAEEAKKKVEAAKKKLTSAKK
jgi:hypothetical protein